MRLHGDVCVQVVQCPIGFFATIPSALVHTFNFFISTPGPLMLLRARNRDKRVDGRQRMAPLIILD